MALAAPLTFAGVNFQSLGTATRNLPILLTLAVVVVTLTVSIFWSPRTTRSRTDGETGFVNEEDGHPVSYAC